MKQPDSVTPTELAQALGIPDPAIGTVMKKLRDRGLKVVEGASEDGPPRYSLEQARQILAAMSPTTAPSIDQARASVQAIRDAKVGITRRQAQQTPSQQKPVIRSEIRTSEGRPSGTTVAKAARALKVAPATLERIVRLAKLPAIDSSQLPARYELSDLREALDLYKAGEFGGEYRSPPDHMLISTGALAEMLGKTHRTMRQYLRHHGVLPVKTVAGQDYFSEAQVLRTIARIERDKSKTAEQVANERGLVTAAMLARETGVALTTVQWRLSKLIPVAHHRRAAMYERAAALALLAPSMDPAESEAPKLITVAELASQYGISEQAARRCLRANGVEAVLGAGNRKRYFPLTDACEAVAKCAGTAIKPSE